MKKYCKLSDEKISELLETYRDRECRIKQLKATMIIRKLIRIKLSTYIKPNIQQKEVLDMIVGYYKINDSGKLIWACGLGKALLAVFIVQKLGFKNVLVGVPSLHLQTQMKKEIMKVFPNEHNIRFVGGSNYQSVPSNGTLFTITTYHSCELIKERFDFKIGDEAHHLVGNDTVFRQFHKIPSTKSLFMTATEKIGDVKYSMDDETTFGKQISGKTVHWAIEHGKITDYNVVILKNTEDEIDRVVTSLRIDVSNKQLFMSCLMCVKSLDTYDDLTHVLLYTNETDDADLAEMYLLKIIDLFHKQIYIKALHSKKSINVDKELIEFKRSPYGIIPCVFMFGEGFDLPKLNGVCIAGNMKSIIRTVQYVLRPNRLELGNPNKKAYIIIPYIDNDPSYENLRIIIHHLRNVDENVEQKICVCTTKPNTREINEKEINDFTFVSNECDLTNIKLRLRYSKALHSKCSEEQDEYNYVKSINQRLKIQSKQEYEKSENKIDDAEKHFLEVWTNWYDFMGHDTTLFIQTVDEWRSFIKEKRIKTVQEYQALCEKYDSLPKEPADFYKGFSNIPNELRINSRR